MEAQEKLEIKSLKTDICKMSPNEMTWPLLGLKLIWNTAARPPPFPMSLGLDKYVNPPGVNLLICR